MHKHLMGGSREDSSRLLSALPSDRTGRQYANYVSLQLLNSVAVPPAASVVQVSTLNLVSFIRNSRRAYRSCRKATSLGTVIQKKPAFFP